MNSQILTKINNFTKNRLLEFSGISLVLISFFLIASIFTYSPSDPNFIYTPENTKIENIGGFYGSVVSDFLLQSIGLISILLCINFFTWGLKIITSKKIENFISKFFFTTVYIVLGTAVLYFILRIKHQSNTNLVENMQSYSKSTLTKDQIGSCKKSPRI